MSADSHNIVFLECDALEATVRRPAFPHRWAAHGKLAAEAVVPALAGASIAIVNKTRLRAAELEQLPDLKLIAISATGCDNVDLAWCAANGIAVCNIRNYAIHTVPEHAFALILALRRSLFGYVRDVKAGKWQQSEQFCLSGHPINDIHGSTIGIFGEGALGQGVAHLARGFGMRVLFADHPPPKADGVEFTPADQVLAESDVITLHAPLTHATRNLIGAREIGLMKRSAILINTGRGGLVDEIALADALVDGRIAGAGFDVLTIEPPKEGNPLLEPQLLGLPNFILTPHTAWASREAMQALADQLIDNIEAFVAGNPRNLVT
jgi:glycerate dehydrogenase